MKAIGWIVKGLLALVLVLVIALGVFLVTFDPNKYHDQLTQVVKEHTGRELSIEHISLALFPHFGLNLENTRLSNAQGFSDHDFLQAKNIQLGVAIMPLFKQQLEVDTLSIHQLHLHLERNAEGINNWDDLIAANDDITQEQSHRDAESMEATDDSASALLEQLAALNFGGLDIRNAQLTWDDRHNDQKIKLQHLNLSTGTIALNRFFNIKLDSQTQIQDPQLNLALDLSLEAKVDAQAQLEFRNLKLNTELNSAELPLKQLSSQLTLAEPKLVLNTEQADHIHLPALQLNYQFKAQDDFAVKQGQGELSLKQLTAWLEPLSLTLEQLSLAYDLQPQQDLPATQLQGQVKLDGLNAKLHELAFHSERLSLDTKIDSEAYGEVHLKLQAQPELNLEQQTAQLDQLQLQVFDIALHGKVQAQQLLGAPQLNTQLQLEPFNLRALAQHLAIELPEMADLTTLTQVAAKLKAQWQSENMQLKLSQFELQLDNTRLSGPVLMQDQQRFEWDLHLTSIDLNRYLPTPVDTQQDSPEPSQNNGEELIIELPTELLRSLNLDGRIRADEVIYDTITSRNILIEVKADQGQWAIAPAQADLFNTRIHNELRLDVRGDLPEYHVITRAANLPIEEILKTLADFDRLSGTGMVDINLATSGDRISQFKQNLNGMVALNLSDGAVKGFNLAQSIREARAMFSGQRAASDQEPLQTDFSSLIGQFSIKDGIVDTEQLSAQAPFMRLRGDGQIDLPRERLDYALQARIVGTDQGQGGREFQDLAGLTIPIRLRGSWIAPNVSLDLERLLTERAQQEIQRRLEEQKQRLADEARKKIEQQIEQQKDEVLQNIGEEIKQNILRHLPF